jgi:hypothetical protein
LSYKKNQREVIGFTSNPNTGASLSAVIIPIGEAESRAGNIYFLTKVQPLRKPFEASLFVYLPTLTNLILQPMRRAFITFSECHPID